MSQRLCVSAKGNDNLFFSPSPRQDFPLLFRSDACVAMMRFALLPSLSRTFFLLPFHRFSCSSAALKRGKGSGKNDSVMIFFAHAKSGGKNLFLGLGMSKR
jgi:hypothetical protein